ncbi:NAD-dependent epimerase/dehydratase family protein [Candidatus Bathyarchaeota archaeon]|nr:MAG: NAD-dependent epimerase/dehydratase family protein [Candidatus Bathyarchaeota archaeon]
MYKGKKVVVTGGASFIGSHLVDSLIESGSHVVVADDLSSGKMNNLEYDLVKKTEVEYTSENLEVLIGNLKDVHFTRKVLEGADIVFHLAALHGGRGYIDSHPAQCCTNMILDQLVFEEAQKANVDRICFASSACIYPTHLQEEEGSTYLLKESDADPFIQGKANADLEYGWAKLMGEMALNAYHRQYGIKTSSVRIFTAYGPRENETHAIIALIAKAFIKMDPYEVWGDGLQDRNFTYVQDIVDAMMLASEKIEDGTPVNAGRSDRITINETIEKVFEIMKWRPEKIFRDTSKPTEVASRAADLTNAKKFMGWEPKYSYDEGFRKTIDWYKETNDEKKVKKELQKLLYER